MYKAVNRLSGEEVLVLQRRWRERLEELRGATRSLLLVCQGCGQPVRLRAGKRKRPHFAHIHLSGCAFGRESAAVQTARAVLFEWLDALQPGGAELEVDLPGFPRPLDILLQPAGENHQPIGYWIIDRLLRRDQRERIEASTAAQGIRLVWIFLERILRSELQPAGRKKRIPWFYLSPCERACIRQTIYDGIGKERRLRAEETGGSLLYLDSEGETLTGLRSLQCLHAPNIYLARQEKAPLRVCSVDAQGEIRFPGEASRLPASQAAAEQFQQRVERWLQPRSVPRQQPLELERNGEERLMQEEGHPDPKTVRCVHCGRITTDWWSAWVEEGEMLGKCRECLQEGKA